MDNRNQILNSLTSNVAIFAAFFGLFIIFMKPVVEGTR